MKIKIFFLFLLSMALAGNVFATPIANTAGDTFEDLSDGSVFGYYQNSGRLLFIQQGNNEGNNLGTVESLIESYLHNDVELTIANNVSFSSHDSNSGTWSTINPMGAISAYSVKAGNYYALYLLEQAESTGSWSTFDIWRFGGPGTGGNDSLQISHFTGYNPTASVPEPASMILFGAGLVVFGFARKFIKS